MKIGWKINMYSLGYNHLLYQINVMNEELKYNVMDINAEWARNQANKVLGDRVQAELAKCESAIKNAANRNEMSCYVGFYAHEKTIQELTNRGFKVKQYDDQRDGSSLHISW